MAIQLARKSRILIATLAALLVLYAALGFWLAPRLVRSQIESFSAQHWQRQPSLGEISFNPFTFTLDVHAFGFKDSRGEPLLAFDRLRVNLDLASLWRRGISFHEIELDNPSSSVIVRADGSLNLDELSAPFAPPPGALPVKELEPARLFIDRFQIRQGAVEFEDRARATPFKARLTPVNFELLNFSTVSGSDNRYSLQAASPAGEKFRWSGNFALAPLASHGEFELADVQARTLWSYLQESLGFEVSDGQVAVHGSYDIAATAPDLTLRLNLKDVDLKNLRMRPRGAEDDPVSFGGIAVRDARIDLGKRAVDVASVRVTEGSLVAVRTGDGRVNLVDLLSPAASAPPGGATAVAAATTTAADPKTATANAPWTVNVPDISVEGLRVAATDEYVTPAAAFMLAPVNLHLRGFSTAPGKSLDIDADLALESGGKLALQGQGVVADETFAATLELDDLDLTAIQPYLGTYTQMTLRSGMLAADLQAKYSPAAWSISGSLDCTKLHTVDDGLREDFVKWDRLSLRGLEYRADGNRPSLRLASIDARSPYLRLIISPDQTTNVGKVLTRPASAPGPVQTVRGVSDSPTGIEQPLSVTIGKVQVDNGSANFADFWITPNYAVSLQQLSGSITGLSSRKDSRAKVALTGKIDRYAPAQIAGELNLLSASLFTDLRVKFDGVELTSVTPYSGRFAGYRIEKGKLSIDVRYLVENRKLDAQQRFIIDQLTLGDRVDSPDAVHLPLKLAVALLKDRNGVIDLGLPVTGDLDDPKFRVGPIIWKAFVNLLGNIATSPFKLIGGLFGGGEEVNLIDFAPGSAELDEAARAKLAALTKALHERPQLSLDVPAVYSPDADYRSLAHRELENAVAARVLARDGKDVGAASDPARRFDVLVSLHKETMKTAALPPAALALQEVRARDRDSDALAAANEALESALLPGIDSLQAELQSLAQRRAQAIQDALLSSGEVEPARVFMIAASAKPAASGNVRVALSLK
jgi:hypothetical protein